MIKNLSNYILNCDLNFIQLKMDQIKENLGQINHEISENINEFNTDIKEKLRKVDVQQIETFEKSLFKIIFGIVGGFLISRVYSYFSYKEIPFKKKLYINSFALDIHQFSSMKLKLSSSDKSVTGKTKLDKSDEKVDIQGSFEGNNITLWIIIKEENGNPTRFTLKGEIERTLIKGIYETNEVKEPKSFQLSIQKTTHYYKNVE